MRNGNGRGTQSLPLQGKVARVAEGLAKRPAGRMRSFPLHIASHDAVYCGTDPIKMGIHIMIAEAKHL